MSLRRERYALDASRRHFDTDDYATTVYRFLAKSDLSLSCQACGKPLDGFSEKQLEGKLSAKVHQGYPITCSKKCKKAIKRREL